MWTSFHTLFGKNTTDAEQSSSLVIPQLTAASPRAKQPTAGKVPLWPHQLAMLARCQEIEAHPRLATSVVRFSERYKDGAPQFKPTPIGIMNDPPGAGKTFALLALILADTLSAAGKPAADAPQPGTNLIIVPQNIYCQWENAIKTFYPHDDKVLYCNSYGVVSNLYMYPELFEKYSIILANDLYADQIAIAIKDNSQPGDPPILIRRLVVDEIDSIQKRLLNPIQAEHVWLLSASFTHDEYLTIGPYKVSTEDVPHVICKCAHEFVAEHFGMINPATETIICEDGDIALFKDLVGPAVLAALNAEDKGPLIKSMMKVYPPEKRGLRDLATAHVKELRERAEELEAGAAALGVVDMSGTDLVFSNEILERQRQKLLGEAKDMRAKADVLEGRLTLSDTSGNPPPTKQDILAGDICQRIKSTPTSRWLIFNDSNAALIAAQRTLEAADISGLMIDAGNAAGIADALAAYKAGKYQVLLLNATTEGAGMNLENTTHMLFMHATNPGLIGQVVGRAQRFGRVGQLRIIGLFNKNEAPPGAA